MMDGDIMTLSHVAFVDLARFNRKDLLPSQQAVLQDPSKASGLAKFITCTQASWFCSQCIARLSQEMAISLLELNTFAHCISAFFIYIFWWHKPYSVATHAYIESAQIFPGPHRFYALYSYTCKRSKNMAREMFSSHDWADAGYIRPLIMFLTFLVYGPIHSLAWGYHFPTHAEAIVWRCASVATASSGLIVLLTIVISWTDYRGALDKLLHIIAYFLGVVAILARSFLVVESFRTLPNSPASIYEVPRWTAYIPHI